MDIQGFVTVAAAADTGSVPEPEHYLFDLRVVFQDPGWSDGSQFRVTDERVNKRKAISKRNRLFFNYSCEVSLFADFVCKFYADQFFKVCFSTGIFYKLKEGLKIRFVFKQEPVDLFKAFISLVEMGNLVIEQISGLDGIIQGVVGVIRLQLVVFQKSMIRF